MNSEPDSQTQASLFSEPMPTRPGKLIFEIEIPGRLPSWNDILGMEQWARYKFKRQLADVFLSALRASAAACSTKTTSVKNTMLTFADTLERYLVMKQAERKSRLDKKKLAAKNASLFESKSSKSKVPF